jgi:hypothetical protein
VEQITTVGIDLAKNVSRCMAQMRKARRSCLPYRPNLRRAHALTLSLTWRRHSDSMKGSMSSAAATSLI